MTRTNRWIFAVVMAIFCVTVAHADAIPSFTVTLTQPNISGAPGDTVGWGFSIANNSSYSLSTIDVNSDLFQHGTASSMFDIFFTTVDPNSTSPVDPFDANAGTGLYEFTWDSDAPIGFTNSGTFVIDANFYDTNGNLVTDANGNSTFSATAAYSVTVSAPQNAPATVPEPSTLILVSAGLALGSLRKKRRVQR